MLNTVAIILSSLAILLIFAGLAVARRPKRHVPLMYAAFAVDMIALAIVELAPLFQGDVDPVSGLAREFEWAKTIHATLATIAVIAYIVQIVNGRRILRGERQFLPRHKRWAKIFLVFRLLAYGTMFTV